jgi:hypothetical protein
MKSQLSILLVLISLLFNTACANDTNHDPKYVEGVVQRSNGGKLINYEVILTSNPNNLWNQFKGGLTTIKIGTDKTKENGQFNISLNVGKIPPKLLLAVVSKKYKVYTINNKVTKIYYHFSTNKIKLNTPNVITVADDF